MLWWFLPYIDMNQPRVYMCPFILNPLPPLSPPHPWALSALLHALNLYWSSILHMVIYTFQHYSLKSSYLRLLPYSPKLCSLHLCLFCCLAYRVVIAVFPNSIYMHWYTVLVFLFLTYFALYSRLQFHLSIDRWMDKEVVVHIHNGILFN